MKRKLIITLLLVVFNIFNTSFANDYFVENIKIKKVDVDAIKARKNAIRTVQRMGFDMVLKRMGIEESNNMLITDKEIVDSIQSMKIKNEKITDTSYYGIVSIDFNPEHIKYVLNKNKISRTSPKINAYLIITILEEGGEQYIWKDSNRWKVPMKNALAKNRTIKLMDMQQGAFYNIELQDLYEYKYKNFIPLTEEYNVNHIVIADAVYKYTTSLITVRITVLSEDSTRTANLTYEVKNPRKIADDFKILTDKVINYVKNIEKEEKAKIADVSTLDANTTIVLVPVSTIHEYNKATSILNSNKNISKVDIKRVTKNLITYQVKFKNKDLNAFIDALEDENISVSNKREGLYVYINGED